MTVIYVDTLFLLNAVVDYLLLLASAKVAGEHLARVRFALAAALGGGYAVAVFLPNLRFLIEPPCRLAAMLVMGLVAFGGYRRLLRQLLIFMALSCAFAGGVFAVSSLGNQGLSLGGGILYSHMDVKIVLLAAAGCYLVLTVLFRRWGKHGRASGQLVDACIRMNGKEIHFTSLVDTGNTLCDPISGLDVMVAEGELLSPLLPDGMGFSHEELIHPTDTLAERQSDIWEGKLRLLPYRAVGVERGMLLALRVDEIEIDGRRTESRLVALSPNAVSEGGNYRALIGAME